MKVVSYNILGIILAVAFLEVLLQIGARYAKSIDVVVSSRAIFKLDNKYGRVGNPLHPDHDERGFRNRKALSHADVVVLGDSHVYGHSVATEQKWSSLLEAQIDKSVYNMAFPGFSAFKNRKNFDDALFLEPQLVIYGVYIGNDFYDDFRYFYKNHTIADCNGDSLCNRAFVMEKVSSIRDEVKSLFPTKATLSGVHLFLSQYSKVYGLLRSIKRSLINKKSILSANFNEAVSSINEQEKPFICIVNDRWRTIATFKYRQIVLDSDDARIQYGFGLTKKAVRYFHEKAQENGTDFRVVILPTKNFVFQQAKVNMENCDDAKTAVEREAWFRMRLFAYLDEERIPYIDPTEHLAAAADQPYFVNANGHPNPLGHRIIAETVASELLR